MSKNPVRQALLITSGFFLVSVGSSAAYEVEALNALRLIEACESFSNSNNQDNDDLDREAVICRSYLQGFFAATDEVVAIENIPSALTVRVLKTRGVRIPEDLKKTYNAEYCISESETLRGIAHKISTIDRTSAQDKTAQTLLRQFLAEHYNCATVKQSSEQSPNN